MENSQLRKLSTPLPLPARRNLLARSNSRSKGINFNTVTPSPLKTSSSRPATTRTTERPSSQPTNRTRAENLRPSSSPQVVHDLQYDFVLPLADQLKGLDMDEQLRLLALKEMNVVELKDGISRLEAKLDQTESDLRQLRAIIQKTLYKEMVVQRPTKVHTLRQTGHKAQGGRPHRRRTVSGTRNTGTKENEPPSDKQSKLWSNLSKPMTFIQQIDNMLLNEFEKSLAGDQNAHAVLRSTSSNDEYDSDPSPLKDKSNYNSQSSSKQYYLQMFNSTGVSDDMFQAVSSSLWSFMNDMKQNMLATLNEPDPKKESEYSEPLIDLGSPKSEPDICSPMSNMDLNDEIGSDEEVDLTMYSSMRRPKTTA